MKRVRSLLLVVAFAFVVTPNVGCRKIKQRLAEKAIEKGTGGKVDIEDDGKTVTLKGDKPGDTVTFGSTTKVPDDFPKSVPIYPSAKVTGAFSATGSGTQGGKGQTVVMETSDTPDQVIAFYKGKMPAGSQKFEMDTNGGKMLTYTDGPTAVSVITAPASDKKGTTTITLSASTKKS